MTHPSQPVAPEDQAARDRGLALMACDVLVIEDDEDCRDVLCFLLSSEGYRVQAVASGADALIMLAKLADAPRLILLDLVMPEMSGFEYLRIMRRNPTFAAIPVVVHSGLSPHPDLGSPAGVERWLQKPVKVEALLEITRQLVR